MIEIKSYGGKRIALYFLICILLFFLLTLYPDICKESISDGISLCVNELVPSVFMFMVVSSLIVNSNATRIIAKCTNRISMAIFGLNGKCFCAVTMSLIGGYPVGAVMIDELYKKGDIDGYEAERLSYFCVGAGAGFVMTFVGEDLLKSEKVGIILYVSQIISVILLGFLNKFIKYKKKDYNSFTEQNGNYIKSPFLLSVKDASKNTLNMCSIVIVFAVISGLAENLSFGNEDFAKVIAITLEVTNAVSTLAGKISYEIIAFAIGFGGFSVAMQIFVILKDIKFSKLIFIIQRILCGVFCSLFTHIGLLIFPIENNAFCSVNNTPMPDVATSVIGSGLLIICMVFFISSLKENRR